MTLNTNQALFIKAQSEMGNRFFLSLDVQYKRKGSLSEKQVACIDKAMDKARTQQPAQLRSEVEAAAVESASQQAMEDERIAAQLQADIAQQQADAEERFLQLEIANGEDRPVAEDMSDEQIEAMQLSETLRNAGVEGDVLKAMIDSWWAARYERDAKDAALVEQHERNQAVADLDDLPF